MADYGRVAWQQGEPVVTPDGGTGRVAWQQGEPVVTPDGGTGRVAWQQGEPVVAPEEVFRVASLFVEAFVVPRSLKGDVDPIQGTSIRRGLQVGAGKARR